MWHAGLPTLTFVVTKVVDSFPHPHAWRLTPLQFLNAIPVGRYNKYYSFSITISTPTASLLEMRLLLVQSATTNSQYASAGA